MKYNFVKEIIQNKLVIDLSEETYEEFIDHMEDCIDDQKYDILLLAEFIFSDLQYIGYNMNVTRAEYLKLTHEIISALTYNMIFKNPNDKTVLVEDEPNECLTDDDVIDDDMEFDCNWPDESENNI